MKNFYQFLESKTQWGLNPNIAFEKYVSLVSDAVGQTIHSSWFPQLKEIYDNALKGINYSSVEDLVNDGARLFRNG